MGKWTTNVSYSNVGRNERQANSSLGLSDLDWRLAADANEVLWRQFMVFARCV